MRRKLYNYFQTEHWTCLALGIPKIHSSCWQNKEKTWTYSGHIGTVSMLKWCQRIGWTVECYWVVLELLSWKVTETVGLNSDSNSENKSELDWIFQLGRVTPLVSTFLVSVKWKKLLFSYITGLQDWHSIANSCSVFQVVSPSDFTQSQQYK